MQENEIQMKHLIVQVFMQSSLFMDKDLRWYSSDVFPIADYLGVSYKYFWMFNPSNAVILQKGIIYNPGLSNIHFLKTF